MWVWRESIELWIASHPLNCPGTLLSVLPWGWPLHDLIKPEWGPVQPQSTYTSAAHNTHTHTHGFISSEVLNHLDSLIHWYTVFITASLWSIHPSLYSFNNSGDMQDTCILQCLMENTSYIIKLQLNMSSAKHSVLIIAAVLTVV